MSQHWQACNLPHTSIHTIPLHCYILVHNRPTPLYIHSCLKTNNKQITLLSVSRVRVGLVHGHLLDSTFDGTNVTKTLCLSSMHDNQTYLHSSCCRQPAPIPGYMCTQLCRGRKHAHIHCCRCRIYL